MLFSQYLRPVRATVEVQWGADQNPPDMLAIWEKLNQLGYTLCTVQVFVSMCVIFRSLSAKTNAS